MATLVDTRCKPITEVLVSAYSSLSSPLDGMKVETPWINGCQSYNKKLGCRRETARQLRIQIESVRLLRVGLGETALPIMC